MMNHKITMKHLLTIIFLCNSIALTKSVHHILY